MHSEVEPDCSIPVLRDLLKKAEESISKVKYFGLLFFVVIGAISMGLVMNYYCTSISETNNQSIKDQYKDVYDYEKKEFTNNFYYVMSKFGALCWIILAIIGDLILLCLFFLVASQGRIL